MLRNGSRVRVKATALKGIITGLVILWPRGQRGSRLRWKVRPDHGPELLFEAHLLELDPAHYEPEPASPVAPSQYGPWPTMGRP